VCVYGSGICPVICECRHQRGSGLPGQTGVIKCAELSGNTYFLSKKEGAVNGVAFKSSSEKGYSGLIEIIVGVMPDGKIKAIGILSQKETPGLGSKIDEAWFKDQYAGKTLDGANWRVEKDKGDFKQISGATISPRAVTAAIKDGLTNYAQNKMEILGGSDVIQ